MVRRVILDSTETKSLDQTRQSLAYRIADFQREVTESSILFEVKGARALWDPDLAGGNGGWRCPPGTRNAGRWTDKFGRNCGVGVARRIGNALRNVAGGVGDGNNDRRAARAQAAEARARKLEERAVAAEQRAGAAVRKPAQLDKPDAPKPVQRVGKPNARIERRRKPEPDKKPESLMWKPEDEPKPKKPAKKIAARNEADRKAPPKAKTPEKPKVVRARPKREVAKPDNAPARKIAARDEAGRKLPPPPRKINPDRVWAKYGLSQDDLAKVQGKSDDDLNVIRRRIRRDVLNAKAGEDIKVYQDIVNQVLEEQDRRTRVAMEAEARRIAAEEALIMNLPVDKVPILHRPGGKPKVTSLRESDFTEEEKTAIFRSQTDEVQKLAGERPDMNDADAVSNRVNELTAMVTAADREAADIEELLRDPQYIAGNMESVRELQKKYLMAKYKKNAIIFERDKMRTRGRELDNRRQAEMLFQQADNPDAPLAERKQALRDANGIVAARDDQQPDGAAWGRDMADWNNQIQSSIEAREEEVFGPKDPQAMMRLGGKPFEKRQKRIQDLVAAAEAAQTDSSKAAALEKLKNELDSTRAERAAMGPLVEDPSAVADNNLRRYLDAKAADLSKEVRRFSPSGTRLAVYDGISPKTDKPAVLGNINDGFMGREIVNPNITSEKDAIDFIANGGTLDEVPNKYWFAAVNGNASTGKVDTTKRFRQVPKNGGIIGETFIFVARDDSGAGTSYGYVFKADRDEAGVAEVLSQQLMVEHGFTVEGGGWDGRSPGRNENFAILPFVSNALGNPEQIGARGGDNFGPYIFQDAGLEKESFAPRVHSFLHNYMLGVSDRHGGNGFTVIADGVPLAIPIDQGWAGRASSTDFATYVREAHGYSMDAGLFNEAARKLKDEGDEAYALSIIEVYDSMIERAEKAIEGGSQGWLDRISPGGPASPAVRTRVESLYAMYSKKLDGLKANRKANLSRLMAKPLYDKLVA